MRSLEVANVAALASLASILVIVRGWMDGHFFAVPSNKDDKVKTRRRRDDSADPPESLLSMRRRDALLIRPQIVIALPSEGRPWQQAWGNNCAFFFFLRVGHKRVCARDIVRWLWKIYSESRWLPFGSILTDIRWRRHIWPRWIFHAFSRKGREKMRWEKTWRVDFKVTARSRGWGGGSGRGELILTAIAAVASILQSLRFYCFIHFPADLISFSWLCGASARTGGFEWGSGEPSSLPIRLEKNTSCGAES